MIIRATLTAILLISIGAYLIFLQKSNVSQSAFPLNQSEGAGFNLPLLTIEQIFSQDHQFLEKIPKEELVVLIATGDVIPARSVNFQATIRKSFTWPFEKVAEVLQGGDITLINLESPLIANCPLTNEGFKFCGDERHTEGLVLAGVDVANVANNHAGNYGLAGLDTTEKLLQSKVILVSGNMGPVILERKGMKFAFLGYNNIGFEEEGISWANEERIKKEISNAKPGADIVVVSFHWGVEYVTQPIQIQKDLARVALDAGADLIIGNHPHWIQPLEIHQGKLITYAHGNFIFDQEWSEKTKEGVVGKYYFYKGKLVDVQFLPVYIEDYGQPDFATGTKAERILKEMQEASLQIRAIESPR